jgi:hypothetical protein
MVKKKYLKLNQKIKTIVNYKKRGFKRIKRSRLEKKRLKKRRLKKRRLRYF